MKEKRKNIFLEIINPYEYFISAKTIFELYSRSKDKKYLEVLDTVLSKKASNIYHLHMAQSYLAA